MIQDVTYTNLTRDWYKSIASTLVDEASATGKRVKYYEIGLHKARDSKNYFDASDANALSIPENKWDRKNVSNMWSVTYGVLNIINLFAYVFSEELAKVYPEKGWFATYESSEFTGILKFALKGTELSEDEVNTVCLSTINRIHNQIGTTYVVDGISSKFSRPRSTKPKLTAADKGIIVHDKYNVRIDVGDIIAVPTGSGATAHGTAFAKVESYSEKTVKTDKGSNYSFDRVFVIASPLNPAKKLAFQDLSNKAAEDHLSSVYF